MIDGFNESFAPTSKVDIIKATESVRKPLVVTKDPNPNNITPINTQIPPVDKGAIESVGDFLREKGENIAPKTADIGVSILTESKGISVDHNDIAPDGTKQITITTPEGDDKSLLVQQHAQLVLMSEGWKASDVSTIIKAHFQEEFMIQLRATADPEQALKNTFAVLHNRSDIQGMKNQGAYVTAVFVNGDTITTAVAGSNQAFLKEPDNRTLQPLIHQIYATDPDEATRILALIEAAKKEDKSLPDYVSPDSGKVNGVLLYPRGIGNFSLPVGIVTPEPPVSTRRVASGTIIVIGSDGLWNAMNEDGVCAEEDVEKILSTMGDKGTSDVVSEVTQRVGEYGYGSIGAVCIRIA